MFSGSALGVINWGKPMPMLKVQQVQNLCMFRASPQNQIESNTAMETGIVDSAREEAIPDD